MESAFSGNFAEASRQVERVLTIATLAIALALVAAAALRTQRLVRKEDAFHMALRASQQRYDYAISGTNDGIFDWTLANRELYLSPRFEELLGHAPGTLHESAGTFLRRVHHAERRRTLALLSRHLANGEPFDVEFRLRMNDGGYRWFRSRGRSVMGERGKPQRMAGSLADISDRKRAEAQTLEQKERAQVTLASIADAVITVDTSGGVEYMNPVAERLTGWRHDEAQGATLPSVFAVQDEATGTEIPDPVARAFVEGGTIHSDGNVVLRRRHDGPIAIDYSAAPIRDNTGSVAGVVLVFHDMSRERQYATRLAHLASHDALTGLLNRREFERRVTMALVESQYEPHHHAVLYVDLDEFKVVNDTCGHAAGDELLRQVSALLRPRLREGDTLARLGGDEFGVLLEHCAPEPAFVIADTLRKTIGDFHFQWNQRSFKIGASVGVVNVAGGPQTLAGVLAAADAACYMAKDKGRNRVQMYSPESDEVTLRKGEMEWVNRIHRALAENRFCLYAQPVQRTRGDDASPPYTELLLRLRGDEGELVPPTSFIPAAERYHLMPAIDRWVIGSAFALLARQFDDAGAPRRHLRDQRVGRIDRRRRLPRFRAGAVRPLRGAARQHLLRDHRNDRRRIAVEGHRVHGGAARARLPVRARRFRRRRLVVHVPQASSGRLPQDRRQLRQGHAAGPGQPCDGRGDPPHRPYHGEEDDRRVGREPRRVESAARDRRRLRARVRHRRTRAVRAASRRAGDAEAPGGRQRLTGSNAFAGARILANSP